MAGIYFHIPYCKQACHYCDFHFSTYYKTKDELLTSMKKEIELRKSYLNEAIETIYFGGGTPSILSIEELNDLLTSIHSTFDTKNCVEITLEANPDDMNEAYLKGLLSIGINRLSIGIQSFNNEILKYLNRNHTAENAIEKVKLAQKVGFENISIDLIYGIPIRNNEEWIQELEFVNQLTIPHVSAYCLTIEPNTVFGYRKKKKLLQECDDEIQAQQFELLCNKLSEMNFEHYEISNFAKNKQYSKHNSSYWLGKNYLGIGPGAHSYNQTSRSASVSNNGIYIRTLAMNNLPLETEILTEEDQYNEYILTRIRTIWGIKSSDIENKYKPTINYFFKNELLKCINEEYIVYNQTDDTYILSTKGKIVADYITERLMIEKNEL